MIRIGLVGFGNMGKTHAFSVAAMPFYYSLLPYEAKIVGVTVHYVTGGYEGNKRHDAAVKANATRKAKKEGGAK